VNIPEWHRSNLERKDHDVSVAISQRASNRLNCEPLDMHFSFDGAERGRLQFWGLISRLILRKAQAANGYT
jgi:hypothetical protein